MSVARPAAKRQATTMGMTAADKTAAAKQLTCAQRIEAATMTKQPNLRREVVISEVMSSDAEALFRTYDSEKTQLLSRGALTELLRRIGLDTKLGDSFAATARLCFDSHSADAHFLALPEFKQLYFHISNWHPDLIPREAQLQISIISARDLPSTDANGKSDPFCTVQCCKIDASGKVEMKSWSKSSTKVVEKTLTPHWGEEFTDKFGYEEGDSLIFHVYDWDKGDKSELVCKAVLPNCEFNRPGGFQSTLPLQILVSDQPKYLTPTLTARVFVKGVPNPPPRLQVTIHGATNLPPADSNGKSDPFCSFQIAGKPFSRSQTKVIQKTLEPAWGENFTGKHRYEDGDDLVFEVRDYEAKNSKQELLGRCTLKNEAFAKMGGFSGNVPLTDVLKGVIPAEGGGAYKPVLSLTVFLTDMMPTPVTTPVAAAAGTAAAESPNAEAAGGTAAVA